MMLRVLPAGCSVEEMVHIRETHMQVESVMHLPGMGAAFHCLRFYIPMIVSMTANIAGTVAELMLCVSVLHLIKSVISGWNFT